MSGIFVSHASADKVLVDPFVDTIIRLGCNVQKESIFYSSGEDTGIPSGSTLNDYVRSKMEEVSLVVAIISPTFQTRPFCVAELGAAWSQVGKLFPIAVPGLEHTDMQGVLTGLIVRYLSDSAALDELHDLVCDVLGVSPGARTWGRYKATWLTVVDDYTRQLTSPRVITPKDYDRALADLEGAREALREAQSTIREQETKIERLASAKPEEVAEILLPEGERERFGALVQQVTRALSELPHVVRDAVWYELDRRELPWPAYRSEEFEEAIDAGWLRESSSGDGLLPNEEFNEVRAATEAVDRLNRFLSGDLSEAFDQWFRAEHNAPPNLHLKRVWDQLF
jgi:hypothetical protein